MKKFITTIVFLGFSTITASAVDFGALSITGGFAQSTSVWGASAQQNQYDSNNDGTIDENQKEHGVFQETFSSQFLELGVGRFVSLGYELTPDSISTPQNSSNEGKGNANTVSVDFNDFETLYLKLNIPGGMFVKYGMVQTDLDIKETMSSGNTYKNVSAEGTSFGAGYQGYIGEGGFGWRIETNYIDLDNVTTNNGVGSSTSGGTTANGGFNEIKATNVEGLTAKVAVTYTFGRN